MIKWMLRIIGFGLLIPAFTLLLIALVPVTYDVPEYQGQGGKSFWQLQTGSRIAYTLIPGKGDKSAYPVIFLQGGPGGPIYQRNIEQLSPLADDGYDVYLYDQIGCGASGRLEHINEYSVDRHKRDLAAIIEKIGAQKVILIGQSWGAMLAAAFISEHPGKIEKVVFTGPGPLLPVNNELIGVNAPDSLQLRVPKYTNRDGKKKVYNIRARFVEALAKAFDWKLASDEEMDAFATLLNHEMAKSTVCNPDKETTQHAMESGSGYYAMVKTAQSFNSVPDVRPGLKGCRVPALIMRGQCDGIKWGFTNEYLQLFSNCKLVVVPNAGHAIGVEQPEVYIETIRRFLAIIE